MFPEKIEWSDKRARERIIQALQSEKLVIGDSDTVPGFLAPLSFEGKKLLDEAKVRKDKPYLILIGSQEKAATFIYPEQLERVSDLVSHFWPGPLTLIFKARSDIPRYARSEGETVALRVPDHEGLLDVLQHVTGLFSTSANRAGRPVAKTVDAIDSALLKKAAYCVVDSSPKEGDAPSTIIDCSGERPRLIRHGAYPVSYIRAYLPGVE